jgi:hypothetical protein
MRFNLDNYETVEARLAKFWEDHPNGQIFTSVHYYDDTRVVFKAEVYKDISDPRPVATGFAEEVRDASPVNRTSHVENAETSSIGRCLANWKYASKTQPRPSRQEMEKVQRMGTQMVDNAADLVTKFREACTKAGLDPQDVAKQADVDLNNLTDSVMPKLRDAFKKMQNKPLFASKEKEEAFLEQVREVIPTATEQEPQIKDPNAPASSAQIGKLRAMLMANGIGERPKQHDAVSDIVNRSISKLDMLTKGEANKAIKALEARSNRVS